MKTTSLFALVAVLSINIQAGTIAVANLDDEQFVAPVIIKGNARRPDASAAGGMQISAFDIVGKEEGVRIASLPPSGSPSLIQSRAFAMAGMAGRVVPTDRMNNPAAWYLPSEDGLQLFDLVTTSFHSWLGATYNTNAATSGEFGHRIVVHLSGRFPVSKYKCLLTTSIGGVDNAFFPVGTNTSTGAEIAFNLNFVGIEFGPNNVPESSANPTTGIWTQGGDDTVYSNGQLPSQVSYDWWYRFGSTTSVNISDVGGFNSLKSEFSSTGKYLKAELIVQGENPMVKATSTVKAELPRLAIEGFDSTRVRLSIVGGQNLVPYKLESRTTVDSTQGWSHPTQDYYVGQSWLEEKVSPQRLFRLKTGNP